MSKRKPLDKAEARERRNRMLESAAAAELSLTEGVREMRAVAGMTQEEFARHRGVSARVIKAIELGQGNPTVATMNRIGQFFGLEVAFVPIKRDVQAGDQSQSADDRIIATNFDSELSEAIRRAKKNLSDFMRTLDKKAADLEAELNIVKQGRKTSMGTPDSPASEDRPRTKRKPRAS